MAGVAWLAEPPRRLASRARSSSSFYPLLDLLAPALLLGLFRAWSSVAAPRLGIYFSAEVLLLAYAYFSVIRAVHLHARSYDRTGRYSRELALTASRTFAGQLWIYRAKIAIAVLAVLLGALVLDVLTAGTGIQRRTNLHLTILFIEIMVWARYGSAIVLAAARWSPPEPPAFAHARDLSESGIVARSFALTTIGFGAVAVASIAAYKWIGALLPHGQAEILGCAAVFVALALLALWLQCRWARAILSQIDSQAEADAAVQAVPRAA